MVCIAIRTGPFPDSKFFNTRILISTARTGLSAWIECRHFYKHAFSLCGFVFKLSEKLTPADIGNRLCKMMISEHSFYIQVFYAHYLVFVSELKRLFIQEILADIGDFFMLDSESDPLLAIIGRSFLLTGKLSLFTDEFLFVLMIGPGIDDLIAVAVGAELMNAYIQTDSAAVICEDSVFAFDTKRDIVFPACR